MARPAKPNMAGSSVREPASTRSTAAIVPTASPYTNDTPRSIMPRSEITTVQPANRTARPEVSMA